ncbi:hypothetical protein BDP55DRAFT_305221 [Colletotrichum godetiae]|uniref:Uncharacterized protein n=1 Tax=Colletotrichum godetiae TaxID=1209918 RepID=A0AAJ0AUR2_9PEZI|nr:uncharacterized protein BDP55DRAFT_305221 [Colletotrichum godetiae]KAK1690738.1 hypothetical protein BDP55DRAFT_305221 [Colletotrichum godetiae]
MSRQFDGYKTPSSPSGVPDKDAPRSTHPIIHSYLRRHHTVPVTSLHHTQSTPSNAALASFQHYPSFYGKNYGIHTTIIRSTQLNVRLLPSKNQYSRQRNPAPTPSASLSDCQLETHNPSQPSFQRQP